MLTHLIASAHKGTFWLPEAASTFAAEHDWIFYFIYWVSVFCFVVGGAVTIGFILKYRQKSPNQRTSPIADHIPLEITWTVIPTLLFIFLFAVGFRLYVKQTTPPANAMQVRVAGYKWFWEFRYPNGTTTNNDLIVPVNTPVRLLMSSEASSDKDAAVIHSLFIPAFRIKRDVVPYHYTMQWFEANQTGEFHLFCAEYCGTGHSKMIGKVKVVEKADFDEAIKPAGWDKDKETLAEFGERTFKEAGCTACHTTTGAPLVGPTLKGVFDGSIALESGETVTGDENYIRESITDPQAKVVKGFPPSMPSYAGRLTDEQIDGLVDFVKSLK